MSDMNFNKGDFLIVENAIGRNSLIRISEVDKKTVSGADQTMKRNAEGKYEKRFKMTVKHKDVIVNLGPTPPPGKVYGVNIEPLLKKEPTKIAGDILFFTRADEEQVATIKKAVVRTFKQLKKKRLGGISVSIEVRKSEGKYAGYYQFLPKAEEDVLCIKPSLEMATPEDMKYIISHEYAHGIWFRMMRPENVARWIALYDKHMAPTAVSGDALQEIYNEICDAGSVRGYMKECDDETLAAIKSCLKHIRSVHGIDRNHLDHLLRHGHDISEYWPEYVEFSERNVIVSEYAMKSPEELFAEAFSFWFCGRSLPKDVQKLLDRSLAQLSKGRINGGASDGNAEDAD